MSAPARRRAASRPRRAPSGVLALVAVAVTTALLVGVEQTHPPDTPLERGRPVAAVTTTQVCLPDPFGGPAVRGTTVLTVAPPVPADGTGIDGRLTATGPDPDAAAPAGEDLDPARGPMVELPGTDEPTVLRAEGAPAVGRASYVTREGASGGAVVQECLRPRAEWWFTGAGADLDHRSRLVLANVDESPAVVDVRVYGPDGQVDSVGTLGMTVAPGESRTLDLVDVAPQADELAVHVLTTRGRVAAAVSDSFTSLGGDVPGRAWLPAQAGAARSLRLGPLPTQAAARTLLVANPTGRTALVQLTVSGAAGSFAPTETSQVRVPAGSLVATDVGSAFTDEAAALRLDSNLPVAASLRSTVRRGGTELVVYAGVLEPVAGPAVAPAVPGGVLHLTAGEVAVAADVAAYAANGTEVAGTRLDVPTGATAPWPLPARAAYVVVDPVRGRPSGGVVGPAADGYASVALRPLLLELRRPAVVPVVPTRAGQAGSAP